MEEARANADNARRALAVALNHESQVLRERPEEAQRRGAMLLTQAARRAYNIAREALIVAEKKARKERGF